MEREKIYSGNQKAGILTEYGFERFDASTVKLYTEYMDRMNGNTGSYQRASNILCWESYTIPYYIVKNGFFLIVNDDAYYGTFTVHPPVGDYEDTDGLKEVIDFLYEVCERLDVKAELIQVKEWMKPYLDKLGLYDISYSYNESESDYIYNMAEFRNNIDKRYVHFNNMARKLIVKYNPVIAAYTEADREALMKVVEEKYCDAYGCEGCVCGCMKEFYERALKYLDIIKGNIVTIKSGDKMLGFLILVDGEDLMNFAQQSIHGLSGFLEYVLIYLADNYYGKYEYMNYEEDMGDEGLRRFKRKVGPYQLSHNYHAHISRR